MFGINPRDEQTLFEAPVQFTATTLPASAPALLVPADPDRVVLILGALSGGPINFGIVVLGVSVGTFSLTAGQNVLDLSFEVHGPLPTYAWSVAAAAAGAVAGALTVKLQRPPELYGYRDVFKYPSAPGVTASIPDRKRTLIRKGAMALPPGVLQRLARSCPRILGG